MGSPADCAFEFRQSHLNMIKESRWLAPLAENTAEMLAWRSVANCHQRHNVCGHFFDERSKATGIWVPIRKVQQCAMIFRCIKLPACLGFVDPAVFAIWARA